MNTPNPAPTPDPLWKTGEALAEVVKAGLSNPAPTPNVLATLRTITVFDSNGQPYEADLVPGDEHRAALAANDAEIAKWKQHYETAVAEWRSMKTTVELVFNRNPESKVLSELQARAEKAEAEIARLNGVERELTLTLREANNENAELLKERDTLRAEVDRLKAELSEAKARVAVEQSCVSKEAFKVKELRAALAAMKGSQ